MLRVLQGKKKKKGISGAHVRLSGGGAVDLPAPCVFLGANVSERRRDRLAAVQHAAAPRGRLAASRRAASLVAAILNIRSATTAMVIGIFFFFAAQDVPGL
jgi:hypothetical protein